MGAEPKKKKRKLKKLSEVEELAYHKENLKEKDFNKFKLTLIKILWTIYVFCPGSSYVYL